VTAIQPEAGSSLVTYQPGIDSPAVLFIGVDGHLHELGGSPGNWTDSDLTTSAGAQPPAPQSGLTGFWTKPAEDAATVFFFYFGAGTDHLMSQSFGPGAPWWSTADLTAVLDGALPVVGRALCSHMGTDHSRHVFFVGSGQHVQELYSSGGEFTENDLTALAGAVPAQQDTALVSYWGIDSSQHVNYIGTDGHVHELYIRPGSGWVDNDLTELAAAGAPMANTALAGAWETDNSVHMHYFGDDGHLHELFIVPGGTGWIDHDLTKVAHAVEPNAGAALDAYSGTDGSRHVNFFGADGHIHELYNHPGAAGAGWVDNDLTKVANAVAPIVGDRALLGYWGADSGQHVYFVGVDGDLHQLYIQPGTGWVDNDLTQLAVMTQSS
jgi:hypothetical protein